MHDDASLSLKVSNVFCRLRLVPITRRNEPLFISKSVAVGSDQPRQHFYSPVKRVETLVAHPLEMTFPLTSRTSFVAVDV